MPDLQMMLAMKYILLLTELENKKLKHLFSSKTTFFFVPSTKQNTSSLDFTNLNMFL